jgi:hypothetical protein
MLYDYNKHVFINCPFDIDGTYQRLEDAIVFTIIDCGFISRSAKESSASGNRILKIQKIIEECQFAVHDISRTELDSEHQLPRFNMPLELGLFLGAQRYGGKKHTAKQCLIFDCEKHRYEKFISDIKGHEVHGHHNQPEKIIPPIRDFLAEIGKNEEIPVGRIISQRYFGFVDWLTIYYKEKNLTRNDLSFKKFAHIISNFISNGE